MDFGRYLPNGSVVVLVDGEKRLIICGRKQRGIETGEEWDYLAYPYPEGYINRDFAYLFNHDQIKRTFFLGFQDVEEIMFQKRYLSDDGPSLVLDLGQVAIDGASTGITRENASD